MRRVPLFSDPKDWAPHVEDATNLSQLVPWAFISGEHGVRKPSPESYAAALAAVGRDAGDVIFVDDSEANVAGAGAVGIDSVRFVGASALRAALHLKGLPLELNDTVLRDAVHELADEGSSGEDGGGECGPRAAKL